MTFKVIQGHQGAHLSLAHVRFPIIIVQQLWFYLPFSEKFPAVKEILRYV